LLRTRARAQAKQREAHAFRTVVATFKMKQRSIASFFGGPPKAVAAEGAPRPAGARRAPARREGPRVFCCAAERRRARRRRRRWRRPSKRTAAD
jgi:hypothetical protein